ncbi:MAG: N-methyl-L-tryptophan oxidase [bacterium]
MYDALVVGLGAMGSAALYHLAERGARVVGVDTLAPPHSLGSTHGRSRIIREAYYEHPSYVPLVRRAYANWAQLEERCGTVLFQPTGGLMMGAPDSALIRGTMASAALHGLAVEELTSNQLARRFPAFSAADGMVGVFEQKAGILFPEQCVRSHLTAAAALGAEIRTNTRVLKLVQTADSVSVVTHDGTLSARRIVLAGGPWNAALLADLDVSLPLAVERQTMHWFDASARGRAARPDEFPVALIEHADDRFFYVMPDLGDGVKAAIHHEGTIVSPDSVDRNISAADTEPVQALVDRFLPAATRTVRESAVCLYTDTPDRDFIIDTVTGMPNVVLVSACSGHGFKFASVIGEVAAQLALEQQPDQDISHFRASRFA